MIPATPESDGEDGEVAVGRALAPNEHDRADDRQADQLGPDQHVQQRQPPALEAAEEVGEPPGDAGAEGEEEGDHSPDR